MLRHLLAIHSKLSAEPPQPLTAPVHIYIAENLDEVGPFQDQLDPATDAPLAEEEEDGKEEAELGLADLPAFLERVADAWLGAGIAKQLAAFAQGMEETTPLDKLRMFTAEEAVHLFCGVPVGPFVSPPPLPPRPPPAHAVARLGRGLAQAWTAGARVPTHAAAARRRRVDHAATRRVLRAQHSRLTG